MSREKDGAERFTSLPVGSWVSSEVVKDGVFELFFQKLSPNTVSSSRAGEAGTRAGDLGF